MLRHFLFPLCLIQVAPAPPSWRLKKGNVKEKLKMSDVGTDRTGDHTVALQQWLGKSPRGTAASCGGGGHRGDLLFLPIFRPTLLALTQGALNAAGGLWGPHTYFTGVTFLK